MAVTPPPTFGALRSPIADKDGRMHRDWVKKFQEWEAKLYQTINLVGEIAAAVRIQGRTEGIGTTVGNLTATGRVNSLDNVNDGTTYARPVSTALNAGQVDLAKVGVIGPLGSIKINQNVMSNYSNNATVDSIDNGVNATIRVYGPGGPGTSWHQFIGAGVGADIPAFSGAAAYNTDFNVYYDGSYHVTANGSDTLPDGIQFSGGLHTVSAGGGGGSGGGGGAGGGTKGSTRL